MSRIIAVKGREQKIFPNFFNCCNYFGIDKKTLKWLIEDGFEFKGWCFDYLCEPEKEVKAFTLPKE